MRYTIILTPTAKSDIVSLKISLVQQLIDQAVIRKELELIYKKNIFTNDLSGTIPYYK